MTMPVRCVLAALFAVAAGSADEEERTMLLIDDFSVQDGRAAIGSEWRVFTDQVVGGVSRGAATRDTMAALPCLRLRGEVSLQNNGGFIQMALPLDGAGGGLDASAYRGFRLTTTGNGRTYAPPGRARLD